MVVSHLMWVPGPNSSPLQEEYTLLTAKLSLQLPHGFVERQNKGNLNSVSLLRNGLDKRSKTGVMPQRSQGCDPLHSKADWWHSEGEGNQKRLVVAHGNL